MKQLLEHQQEVLREIESAARRKDAARVMSHTTTLDRITRLIRKQEEIDSALIALKRGGPIDPAAVEEEGTLHHDGPPRESGKARGRKHRTELVRELSRAGVDLRPLSGAVLKTVSGLRVGIAYSREGNKDRWFLGLPEDGFDHAVLICEHLAGKVSRFFLGQDFIAKYGRALSRKDGQVKFNVLRRGGEFLLNVPRHGAVSIARSQDNFEGLKRSA